MIDIKIISALSLCSLTAIVGIGASKPESDYKIIVNYNGQADLLISLQIPPDYYPYQFKKTTLYDYLTQTNRYIVTNEKVSEQKKIIKNKLQNKINELLGKVKEFGPSLWNRDLYDTGIVFRNDQFWNSKKTTIMFLEQFISDDYTNISDSYNLLPAHKNLIVTNYRAARDPYTIFKKEIFECFKKDKKNNCNDEVGKKFKEYIDGYQLVDINSLYRFGKYIEFWNNLLDTSKNQLEKLGFQSLLKEDNLFSLIKEDDQKLFNKYKHTLFTEEENKKIKEWESNWKMNYESNGRFKLQHHPALEQQILPGTAPLAEGSQKDIIIFLYQFAALIDQYTKTEDFKKEFQNDYRKEYMEKALENSQKISNNISTRIKNIREYFKKIKVVDSNFDPENKNYTVTNSKTFTVLTYPPTSFGAGDATIQSMSKFPFIYQDIGLKQPVPNDLSDSHTHYKDLENWSFSVDDNGWWWKIGNVNLDPSNMIKFSNTTDTLLLLANEDDWNLLNDVNSNTLKATGVLLKSKNKIIKPEKINNPGYEVSYNKYHLWNEGLRSPIALNLLLDNLVDIFQKQYDINWVNKSEKEYSEAMDWGNYWNENFLKN